MVRWEGRLLLNLMRYMHGDDFHMNSLTNGDAKV